MSSRHAPELCKVVPRVKIIPGNFVHAAALQSRSADLDLTRSAHVAFSIILLEGFFPTVCHPH
jgi:hypothetical protein